MDAEEFKELDASKEPGPAQPESHVRARNRGLNEMGGKE